MSPVKHTPPDLRSAARVLLALPAFVLLAACPKPTPPETGGTEVVEPSVQIDSLDPSETTIGEPVTVTLRGKGFVEGSEVYLGSTRARGVDVYAAGELTFRATEELEAQRYDVRVVTPAGDQAALPDAFTVKPRPELVADCVLTVVYFDYSEASLTQSSRDALANNAACIAELKLQSVLLEGHADERGSTTFNLSLGEERAEAVREYLVDLGAMQDVFSIVTYGEERPFTRESNEEGWSKNRRVEFVVQ